MLLLVDPVLTARYGALDWGSPMLHVDFKKGQCPLSSFYQFPCRFENSLMPPFEFKGPCHVGNVLSRSISSKSRVNFNK